MKLKKKTDKNLQRLDNAYKWSKVVGTNLYKVFNYPDQKLDKISQLKIVKNLKKITDLLKPDTLYTHHPFNINKDHQVTAQAALFALRLISYHNINPEIRSFETPSSTDQAPNELPYIFKPNFYVDIQSVWNKKILALKAYSKELKPFPNLRSFKEIKALAIKRGSEVGVKKAEAFSIIRSIWK